MRALVIAAVVLLACTHHATTSPVAEDAPDNELSSDNLSELRDEAYAEGEQDVDDDDEAMDINTMEKTLGIEIPICAQYAELTYPLHLSHLTECDKFYKCSNGRGYLFDCPAGEHWSVKFDRCDYPELAGCIINGMHQYKLKKVPAKQASADGGDGVVVDPDDEDEDNGRDSNGDFEVDPRCEGGDPFKPLHFAHPKDCSKFYKCYMGKAYVIKCPKGQHWGQRLNRCEHPTLARCTVLKPTVQASIQAASLVVAKMDIPEKKPSILDDPDYMINDPRCATDAADRFNPTQFAHPSDCQMLYKCFNKHAYKVSCPQGLHYSEATKACDYPEIANCQATVAIQRAQHSVETPSIPDCSHGRTLNIAIQGSATRYFQCHNGELYLRECVPGEFFNFNVLRCDRLPVDQHARGSPYWPTYTPYGNYYNQPMWWGMNGGNYPPVNWQYPVRAPNEEEREQKVIEKSTSEPAPEANEQQQQQQPSRPEFPSWLPQLNTNIGFPQQQPVRPAPRPTAPEASENGSGFDFTRGQHSSRCPRVDDPVNPVHLAHETSCTNFYKCFQQKAFLMECPNGQEWSSDLQRCDFHIFANCDPSELAKQKIHPH